MTHFPTTNVGLDILEIVLGQPTVEHQAMLLSEAGLLNAAGLSDLLDMTTDLIRQDPGKARQLAALCLELADRAAAPAVVPRATYLCAQAHASNAEFELALQLIESACAAYVALGENQAALRTNIGRMGVLIDLGRYEEALNVSEILLTDLQRYDSPETGFLAALAYQNRGACYEQMGRYEEALEVYAAAEQRYLALDMVERIGDIYNNRGVVLLQLGRGNDALAAFEAAADIFAQHNLTLLHAQALLNIGNAHLLLSNYTISFAVFNQARQLFESLGALAEQHVLMLDTADTYLALNLYPEALAAYRDAESLFQTAGVPHHRARALWGMGSALSGQGQLDDAESMLSQAASLFVAAQNIPLLCSVMLEQAALQAARGDRATAQATAAQALALVSDAAWPVQQVYAHMRIADLLLPNVAEAEPHLLEAQRLGNYLGLPHFRYRINQRLGHVRLLQGRTEESQLLLEAAANEIEWIRGTLAQEVTRISFLSDKLAVYEDLMQLHLMGNGETAVWQAFAVTERAKSRALVDLLMGRDAMYSVTPGDSVLATRLESLTGDLNAIYNELLGTPQDCSMQVGDLQARAVVLEHEISQLRLQAASNGIPSDPLQMNLPLDAILSNLPADLLIVAYHVVGEEILAFVVKKGRLHVIRHLSTVSAVQQLVQHLAVQWERLRVGQSFIDRHYAILEQSAQRVLTALYTALVAPLELLLNKTGLVISGVADADTKLAVVPHGVLHHVPFHALYDGQQYLLDRFEISYAPSVTVLALCQQRTPRTAGTSLVFGVTDPLLPAVAAEAHAVADYLSDAQICIDQAATRAILSAKAPNCAVVHLACHGLFRADNPMFSALKLHDGWLTALDVMQYDLRGALVTLSACESGRSQVMVGDESIGLMRAFLGAGAASLVVSLWLVQDETTAALMAAWYAQLRQGKDRAAALRAAQLAIKATHSHPFYWAPFVLVGQR